MSENASGADNQQERLPAEIWKILSGTFTTLKFLTKLVHLIPHLTVREKLASYGEK